MSYVDDKYRTNISMKLGPKNWSDMNRDGSRGPMYSDKDRVLLDRDGVGHGPLDRDLVGRALIDRDLMGRALLERDLMGLERDLMSRGLLKRERDLMGRGLPERERDLMGRGLPERERDLMGRGLPERERDLMGRGLPERERDLMGRGLPERERDLMGRGLPERERDLMGRGLPERERDLMGRGLPERERDLMGRGLPERERDLMGRGLPERERDLMGRGLPERERDLMGRGLPERERDLMGRGLPERERDLMGRGLPERDLVGRGLPERDLMGRGLPERDLMGRGLPERERDLMGRGLPERDRDLMGRGLPERERDLMGRGLPERERDLMGRGLPERERDLMGRGLPERDLMGRGLPERERDLMGRGLPERERDLMGRGLPERERDLMGRGPPERERDLMGRGPPEREQDAMGRGPPEREQDAMGRGPQEQDAMGRGPQEQDAMGRGPQEQDAMGRGPPEQELMGQGPPVKDGKDWDGKTTGPGDQDDRSQKDMEQSDIEESDAEPSDAEQSDIDQSDVDQGNVTQAENKDVDPSNVNVNGVDSNKEDKSRDDSKKSDNPEDEKKKHYCEVCRLTCLSFMSFQSHLRGAKHLKAARASETVGITNKYNHKKLKKTGKTLKDYMDEPVREPLIGLEHVQEYSVKGKVEPNYHCELCNFKTELAPMIEHLNGFKHRRAYISKEFPFLLKAPPGQKEDKVQFLRRMAADIERDEGLKMYRMDLLAKKKKLKSLLDIRPDEIDIKRSRWDNLVPNNEALKSKAVQAVESYEVDSDSEALLVMTITQDLTENLKTYCLKVKEEAEHAEKVARAKSVAEALSQAKPVKHPGSQEPFGIDPYSSGSGNRNLLPNQQTPYGTENRNWSFDQVHHNQQAKYPAGGPNLNPVAMQNQPTFGHGNWDREPLMQNTLLPQKDWNQDPLMQVGQSAKAENVASQPASFGRSLNPFGPKGMGSELRPFIPNESRGPGGFLSGNHSFGNEYSRSDRGPLPGSLAGGPAPILGRNNPLTPGINRLVDVPRSQPGEIYIRSLQEQGTPNQPISSGGYVSGSRANFTADPKMLHANMNLEGRMGNVGLPQFLPQNTRVNSDRVPLGPSAAMEFPRAMAAEKKASPLTAEILNRIRGKDVKSATVILASLVASNPTLQKVNISNLLTLLVQTGTIK
ncbi:uncharacterized protein [Ambystoma mexicanum]|uniref:uncharacterized protein isoform X2 n=1 Tax=Ambystoma mexicanum TaxID=8296 RepID=UPI0037E81151